jgi:hypothetical protein
MTDRRAFLKAGAATAAAAAAAGCTPPQGDSSTPVSRIQPDAAILAAVAEVVLPAELGGAEQEQVVRDFRAWIGAYEPVPELDHGYGTAEIRYGPPDPAPAWQAQLLGLDVEARKRHGVAFADLDLADREVMIRRHLRGLGAGMPPPLQASHIAVAILSRWLAGADATDRCYGLRISPRTCRGIESSPREPEAVG